MGKNKGNQTQGSQATVVQTEAAAPVVKLKWYEVEGAYTLEKDDIVYIAPTHKDFGNRFGIMTRPSNRPGGAKGYLLNPKNGEAQGTEVVMDMDKLTVIAKDGIGADVLPELSSQFELVDGLYKQVTAEGEAQLPQAQ